MKKIVCFGGGNAMPKAVLPGLKRYPVKIISITSMIDNGGSTGQLRKDFNILPPGDIRRHLTALSDAPEWKKKLFSFRFGSEEFDNGHKGHSLGNIFLAGLENDLKDYEKVLEIVHEFMDIKNHQALPATIERTQVFAELENGEIIEGEDEIDAPKKHNVDLRIKKIFLNPKVNAYSKTLNAILEADLIVIGPGDMYSSLMPCFLPKGIKNAMQETSAKKVFICPPLTKFWETNGFSILDFSNESEKYIGCALNYIVYNNPVQIIKRPITHEIVKTNEKLDKNKFVCCNLLADGNEIIYDSDKVAKNLIKFL